ncbi:MAG: IMP dehydrogenase, partial [Burkholderiales bacterium 21-58-4]
MTIRVALNHRTRYRYDKPVALDPHVFRLRPAVHSRTKIESYSLKIRPEKHFINWQQDPFGNHLARVVFPEKTRELSIEVDLVVDMTVINPFDFFVEEYAEKYPFDYDAQLRKELSPYLEVTESGPLLEKWLEQVDRSSRGIVDFLVELNSALYRSIGYTVRMAPGVQTCEETLVKALGSCRDSGWLLVQIMRRLGLAARFVSGYLVQLAADVKSLDGPSGPEADFTDLHAWAEVYVPGAGWIGLDPTSGLFAGEGHIPLACTTDPSSAAPVTGGYQGEGIAEFFFENSVQRIREDPRVSKPYSDAQWHAIDRLGREIDAELETGDVRLTMGGEPTFVSIDDMASAQWNTAADGHEKRLLAGKLMRRLKDAFGPGGMLYFGQGKWYPGEALPRWQLACFWRKDGMPVWRNPELLADENGDYDFTIDDAEAFARQLSKRLGVDDSMMIPGYEDPLHYLQQEGMTPANLDPLKADLKDPLERQRLMKLLEGDPGAAAGYVLPLYWNRRRNAWGSSPWTFRRKRMFLIPGDSAMGLRLPLSALPWVEDREVETERSLFEEVGPLGDTAGEVSRRYSEYVDDGESTPESVESGEKDWIPHTALCVEPREGRMHVFLPPTTELEHYLDLAACIEDTAEALAVPVVLEGYQPPRDIRLSRLPVTPDPGVIEVNIHPASNWDELARNTVTLAEAG